MTLDPAAVTQLVEFGFPEANVRAALTATHGNPDEAYALLESGIPVSSTKTIIGHLRTLLRVLANDYGLSLFSH